MGQINLTVSLVMLVCFTIAIVVFVANFGYDNNSAILITDDGNYSSLNGTLNNDIQQLNNDSETSLTTGLSTTQEQGDQSASSGGQFKVGVLTALSMTTTILWIGYEKIFGQDSGFGVFLTAIISVLGWIIGLYFWKTWKGAPD